MNIFRFVSGQGVVRLKKFLYGISKGQKDQRGRMEVLLGDRKVHLSSALCKIIKVLKTSIIGIFMN